MATIFVVACEASGDWLGAQLIRALSRRRPALKFIGVGGPLMQQAGHFQSLIPLEKLSVMGVGAVLRHLPRLYRGIVCTADAASASNACGLLTIDGPDFCLRVSRRVRGMPRLHCVVPSVWAWRPKRATTIIPKSTDGLLSLFPFEAPYFPHMPCTFIGHPVLSQPKGNAQRLFDRFAPTSRQGPSLDPHRPLLCLLPGSRAQEINVLFDTFLKTYDKLRQDLKDLQAIMVCPPHLKTVMEGRLNAQHRPIPLVHSPEDKQDAFAASTAALAASGTVTLELARQGTPTVIAYRLGRLTAWMLRRVLTVPCVGLVNIVAAKALERGAQGKTGSRGKDTPFFSIAPECLQDACTPTTLAEALHPLLTDDTVRQQHKQQLQEALDTLWAGDPFADLGAQTILTHFGQ